FSSPSSSFSLPRLIPPDIGRQRSIAGGNGTETAPIDGHLTAMSDVYSFGVVLLEFLTGRKSLDKSRPVRQQTLTDWAAPLLTQKKKFLSIVDPRLGGDYPEKAVQKMAMLAYHCLDRNPKARPLMRDIVESLEPLQEAVEVPISSISETAACD
ncbi:hypothetical protein BHM03_00052069, partial [Ensete ventricosum]